MARYMDPQRDMEETLRGRVGDLSAQDSLFGVEGVELIELLSGIDTVEEWN